MTPQDNFMVAVPIEREREADLRALLAAMNIAPGQIDPANNLVPFAACPTLHFARLVILDDKTLGDLAAYGETFDNAPLYLAFLGDCDGPSDRLLAELVQRAEPGLRQIFSHCTGYDPKTDLRVWMQRHAIRASARYVNDVGRTVRSIREDASLHAALIDYAGRIAGEPAPGEIRAQLQHAVQKSGPTLRPPDPTPWMFYLQDWATTIASGFVLLIAALLLLTPLILLVPFYLIRLRQLEAGDPVIAPRLPDAEIRALAALEDHDLVNPFSAFGSVKPGLFRKVTLIVLLFILNFAIRVLFARGRLARIGTIHFARWVFIDDRRRLFFASNYDRSLDTYADDFINKVAFGINLVFSNGIGYPATRFLILDGAQDERSYRHYLRRHQVPTQVWYNAYPGLTVSDIERNARIREGFDQQTMSEDEIRRWLALI